jgi:5-methylcytosine-specific restriction protein A
MPAALLRACSSSGCPTLVRSGRCTEHERAKQQAYDNARGTSSERGYGSRWRKYRDWFLAKWRTCGAKPKGSPDTQDSQCKAMGRIVAATVVDHIVPVSGPQDPTFYKPECHQALCDACHNAKRQRESRAVTQRAEHRRYVVTGPPSSGKSTWVKHRAKAGDLVWDLDDVASVMTNCGQALPREVRGHQSWAAMKALLVMRDALVQWLSVERDIRADVYVIVTDTADADTVAQRIGAEVVHAHSRPWAPQ